MSIKPNREQAMELFLEFNQSDSLLNHALAVEAVMRHYGESMGEDIEKWGVIGLLHDLDYEKYPDEHCVKTAEILRERGVDEDYIRAIMSHGWQIRVDVEPILPMEKVLYACDEVTGLITACVLMRPSKSVLDLELGSVKKKFKDKKFAAGVDRELVQRGAEMMGVTVDELIAQCIAGMRKEAELLGLKGNL